MNKIKNFKLPMVRLQFLLACVSFFSTGPVLSQVPSYDQNAVIESRVRMQGRSYEGQLQGMPVDSVNRTIRYFDGLGRFKQSIEWSASPTYRDLVQPIVYDAFGRESKRYLPYSGMIEASDGSYKSNAVAEQNDFYTNPSAWSASGVSVIPNNTAFSVVGYEASPLNRVLEQGAPGLPWQPASSTSVGHTVKTEYSTNLQDEVIKLWSVAENGNGATATVYRPGKLYKTITRDENWVNTDGKIGTIEEFKDFGGRVVLKRIWESETKTLNTYYVYDNLGNLRYVLPPAVNENGQSLVNSFTEADAAFDQFIYAYHYDGKKRVIENKIPGKGWNHIVYNKLDQVVLTQDAVQRSQNKWLFTKYDAFGRVVMTGIYVDGTARAALQSTVDSQSVLWENKDHANTSANGTGYTNQTVPSSSFETYLSINYYDDYDFYDNSFGQPDGVLQMGRGRTKGLLTGTKVTILGTATTLLTVNYYDEEGRIAQVKSQNHLTGTDVIDNTWNFAGELTASTRTHRHPTNGVTTIATRYTYDHMGRKLSSFQSINGQPEVLLSRMEYNEVGQLKNKKLHSSDQGGSFLHSSEYTYNERGWLKSATGEQFSLQLNYNDGSVPQYNGNISGQSWGTGVDFPNTFAYGYDKLNRLTSGSSTGIVMSEMVTYDMMGNIISLNRDGAAGDYVYTGNRLDRITGGLATGVYSYDANGNVIKDGRNGVDISYNYLNLPVTVSKADLNVNYTYDATGTKLKKVSGTETTDYLDGIQYKNGVIEFIQTEEGIARNNGTIYSYEYNLSDHLGNVRATVYRNPNTNLPEVIQRDDYYAFGLRKQTLAASGDNKYLYNGKELQQELGQYDYGARFYDPVIGRWNVVDPKADMFNHLSPYNYGMNNPVLMIDPDGMAAKYNWDTGKYEDEGKEVSWDQVQKDYGINQNEQEPKSKEQQKQDALNSWNNSMLKFNDFMNDLMQMKIFAEGFGAGSPLKARQFVAPKASLTIEAGGSFSASEISAAEFMKKLGNRVLLRKPQGTRAGGETSDLLVNGKSYDVYTPVTSNARRIMEAMQKKNDQTTGIILDLSRTSVTAKDLGNVLLRLRNGGATRITSVIIMPK